ncbi:MAG: protein translocase subunit SecD [Actinomycetota bacterium]|nr:protein translocase subunit SecD [Actinomycetota bacterium]
MRRHVIRLILSILVVLVPLGVVVASDTSPQLGLDLQGGISVVLAPTKEAKTDALSKAVEIIRNRVDALGVAEPDVSLQGDNIVVDLPGVEDQDKARDLVGTTAELRFRPVLQVFPPGSSGTTTTTAPGATTTTGPGGATTTTAPGAPTTVTTTQRGTVTAGQAATTTTVPATTPTTAPPAAPPEAPPGACVPRKSAVDDPTAIVVLPFRETDEERKGTLECLGPAEMTGEAVKSAKARFESGWGVTAKFTEKGAEQFNALAAKYFQRQVAIVLDGVVISDPTIQAQRFERGEAEITGNFSEKDARDLALTLRYGALPIELEERQVQAISPTLGRDQLRSGVAAGLFGLGLVMLYMLLYYRMLGIVIWAGLLLAAGALYAMTSWLSQVIGLTLTLAGVTGIIVSVGITVDSYVVYFERLKDEVRSGKTIRSSLDRGFARSFRTILAADLVSLIGAALLYFLAVGSVRGFAFFLGLSTMFDILVSYFFMHPLVSIIGRSPRFTRASWLGVASGLDAKGVTA